MLPLKIRDLLSAGLMKTRQAYYGSLGGNFRVRVQGGVERQSYPVGKIIHGSVKCTH